MDLAGSSPLAEHAVTVRAAARLITVIIIPSSRAYSDRAWRHRHATLGWLADRAQVVGGRDRGGEDTSGKRRDAGDQAKVP